MNEIELAKQYFNETWDLLDKQDRTAEDNVTMLHKAHTSCMLWRSAGDAQNNSVGEWQVSHVYSALGYGEPALLHAQYCLKVSLEGELAPFYLAFAYEALARAYAVLGDRENMLLNQERGRKASGGIKDEDDKQYTLGEINNIVCAE